MNQNSLTSERIAQLSTKKGVKKIAVENFLGSLFDMTHSDAMANLQQDTRVYKWNAATQKAIKVGINEAKLSRT